MYKCVCRGNEWCDDDRCCKHLSIQQKYQHDTIDTTDSTCIQKQILDALKSFDLHNSSVNHDVFDIIDNPLYYTDPCELLPGVYDYLTIPNDDYKTDEDTEYADDIEDIEDIEEAYITEDEENDINRKNNVEHTKTKNDTESHDKKKVSGTGAYDSELEDEDDNITDAKFLESLNTFAYM